MPTLLYIFGLRFYFYSNEHEPMHIHVQSSDGGINKNLENFRQNWTSYFGRSQ